MSRVLRGLALRRLASIEFLLFAGWITGKQEVIQSKSSRQAYKQMTRLQDFQLLQHRRDALPD